MEEPMRGGEEKEKTIFCYKYGDPDVTTRPGKYRTIA
jgi:hypothetical protein